MITKERRAEITKLFVGLAYAHQHYSGYLEMLNEVLADLDTLTAANQRMREALDWGDTTWHQASWAGRETWWKELRRRATDGPKEAK